MNRLFLALLLLLCAFPAHAQLPPGQKAMAVRLVPETSKPAAGSKVALALVMSPRPGWHGYWLNPGDAGVGTRIAWRLPEGAEAGPIRFPVPERLIIQGLMNYVFEGEHALLVDLQLPPGLAPGTKLPVRGKVDYLVCTDRICVPESADLAADLEIGEGRSPAAGFDHYRQALPRPLPEAGRFERRGGRLRLAVPLPATVALDDPYFYPVTEQALVYSAPQSLSRRGDWLIVETEAGDAAPASIEGVLKLAAGQGLSLRLLPGEVGPAGTPVGPAAAAAGGGWRAVLLALAGALLGGLLLNIMPCVFPILSLKALNLARAGGSEATARREA
ncbi:MAG TPA: protein-disulfide reductase DsbD domain-containing protein, partial [Allosphingosinicella sp.]|nr:protein-disulfide reductase DsbD domain-containing protein [Allosphingosinicella sp.]